MIGKNFAERTMVVEDPQNVNKRSLSDRERLRQKQLDRFWTVWSNDYLRNLPPTVPKFQRRGQLSQGSVVLVREENLPRMRWPIGGVVKLHPGRDGLIRAVDVKTKKGVYTRAVQRLHDLEIAEEPSDIAPSEPAMRSQPAADSAVGENTVQALSDDKQVVTRYGRVVKKRVL